MDRTVYSAAEMQRLVAPRTIAVVGASEQPGAFGERTLTNLSRFKGKVFGVNPKYRHVLGQPLRAQDHRPSARARIASFYASRDRWSRPR